MHMSTFELAQLNVATMRGALDSPTMAEFAANISVINEIAESMPGFVWRSQSEADDAAAVRLLGPGTLANVSVWRDVEALGEFVYGPAHGDFLRRRRQWFERMSEVNMVLWWIPAGQRPSMEEAVAKLRHLQALGPTPEAFGFRSARPAPTAGNSRSGL
jgi:hypothetical protein